jgi:hypothetical protein
MVKGEEYFALTRPLPLPIPTTYPFPRHRHGFIHGSG